MPRFASADSRTLSEPAAHGLGNVSPHETGLRGVSGGAERLGTRDGATPPGRPRGSGRHCDGAGLRPIRQILAKILMNAAADGGAGARGRGGGRPPGADLPGKHRDTLQQVAADMAAGRLAPIMAELFAARLAAGISAGEMAKKAGLSGAGVTHWRDGRPARLDTLDAAAEVLGLRLVLVDMQDGALAEHPGGWGAGARHYVVRPWRGYPLGRSCAPAALAIDVHAGRLVPAMGAFLACPELQAWGGRELAEANVTTRMLAEWRDGLTPPITRFTVAAARVWRKPALWPIAELAGADA